MPVKIVLISRISIAVNVVASHKQQHIELDRQIIECLVVLIFHTLFAAIIGFDSKFANVPALLSNDFIGKGISSSRTILWHQVLVAGLTHVLDTFNGQSVWTITINLIPAVDLMMCTAKLWPAHWIKAKQKQQLNRRQRPPPPRRRRQRPQIQTQTIAAHQNNDNSIFTFRKHFKSRGKVFTERQWLK